jgi:hypothetical protein
LKKNNPTKIQQNRSHMKKIPTTTIFIQLLRTKKLKKIKKKNIMKQTKKKKRKNKNLTLISLRVKFRRKKNS